MKQAFALVRVSSTEQDTQSQIDDICKIAKEMKYEIASTDIFAEKISGYDEDDSKDRDSIIKLEEQILLRKPDAIFVWELSRLTRRAIKVQRYIDRLSVTPKVPMYFADYKVWTLDEKTKKPIDDNIMMLVGGAKSVELERERIKARTSRGRDAKAEQGFYIGHLADGYTWEEDKNGNKVFKKDEPRAELIEKIFTWYVEDGKSAGMIRDILNSQIEKYPTANNYRRQHPKLFKGYKDEYKDRSGNILSRNELLWTDNLIGQILRDTWYKGVRYYHDEPYAIPKIVDEDLWQRAQDKLDSARTIVSHAKRNYLVSGFFFCGNCGRKMYAHGDEYLNNYYCSSQEYGKNNKCGLRWLRQENVDSIVFNIVKSRATEDITYGEKTVFSDFFEPNPAQAKTIEKEIKTHNRIIKRAQDNINSYKKEISFFIGQQATHANNPTRLALIEEKIKEKESLIKEEEKTEKNHRIQIDKLKKQKKMLLSVADKLDKVNEVTEFTEMRALIQSVVSKVLVYNPDKSSSVLKIEYLNGEADYAIYNASRLKRRYIFLSQDYQKWMKMKYDVEKKVIAFDGYYLAISPTQEMIFDEENDGGVNLTLEEVKIPIGKWNTEENRELLEKEIDEAINKGDLKEEDRTYFNNLYLNCVEQGIIWNDVEHAQRTLEAEGFKFYKDFITVQDYVSIKRNSNLYVFDYADLLPISPKGIERRNWHRELYKKRYNTGKPSSVPYIEKGVDYDRVCRERKHLYNRKYKILHNKSLTSEQKEKKILDIMEKLEAYKYQLKYLPTNEKGVQRMKKYNSDKKK